MRQPFPKDHPAFSEIRGLKESIKNIEDRIEQTYIVDGLMQSLVVISEITGPKPVPKIIIGDESSPDMTVFFELLLKNAPEPNQFDRDRDAILRLVRRYGKSVVLAFISPKLLMNLEVLFSGIVVGYIRIFNESKGRSQLNYRDVFKNNDLREVHKKINALRNQQYAHIDISVGRHQLFYKVDKSGGIFIDADAPQNSQHYYLEMCGSLHQCLACVRDYLRTDIKKKSDKLIDKLSESQKTILREEWGGRGFS